MNILVKAFLILILIFTGINTLIVSGCFSFSKPQKVCECLNRAEIQNQETSFSSDEASRKAALFQDKEICGAQEIYDRGNQKLLEFFLTRPPSYEIFEKFNDRLNDVKLKSLKCLKNLKKEEETYSSGVSCCTGERSYLGTHFTEWEDTKPEDVFEECMCTLKKNKYEACP